MSQTLMNTKLDQFRSKLTPSKVKIDQTLLDHADAYLNGREFPTTRDEFWKYTRLTKISNLEINVNASIIQSIPEAAIIHPNAQKIVFENGVYRKDLSDNIHQLSGVQFSEKGISNFSFQEEVFYALNYKYSTDAITIDIESKTILKDPIHVILISSGEGSVSMPRIAINADKFSESEIIVSTHNVNSQNCLTNVVIEVDVQENAKLTINKVQNEKSTNFSVFNERVDQALNSCFTLNTLTLNGSWVRNNVRVNVKGQNVETHLLGAYVTNESQHVDNHTLIDHLAPNCQSNELYKGVLDGKSTGVFNGKVFVRKDAQKINAFQSNGNVLLSDDATINSKPELEIYADDVKCSHGSTTGQLDEDAVYYLRTRGLSEKSARHLLVTAFIGDVLEKVEDEHVVKYAESALSERYGWSF